MIVAFPPGGGTDVAARTLARFMSAALGQPIVVNNRAGAGGELGFTDLARARPDGYTIGFINTPNVVTIPIERRARYRLEDFSLVANVVDDPGAFFVLADSPFRTLADLVAHAKAKPEDVTYGTSGIGSDDHLAALAFERLAGVKLTHVPFAGASAVRNALLGRQITMASLNMGEGFADMQSGAARALGQMAERRWEVAPDTPTFREQGFDIVEGSMRGVAAPAGVPRECWTGWWRRSGRPWRMPSSGSSPRSKRCRCISSTPTPTASSCSACARASSSCGRHTPGASATNSSVRGRIQCTILRTRVAVLCWPASRPP